MFEIRRKAKRCDVILRAWFAGDDIFLTLTGGKEHIGAVALGTYNETEKSASASVLTAPGHREDIIALESARKISKKTHKTTVVTVGIHVDNITKEEINQIIEYSNELINEFLEMKKDN